MKIIFTDQPNETNHVQLKPGEGLIIDNNGNAEYGISVVLSKNGKEFVITGPFNNENKIIRIKAK